LAWSSTTLATCKKKGFLGFRVEGFGFRLQGLGFLGISGILGFLRFSGF
jgi:hypothetical protein